MAETYPGVETDEDEKKRDKYPGAVGPISPRTASIPASATADMPAAMPAPQMAGATPPTFPMQSNSPVPTMAREPGSDLVRRGNAMAPAPINPQAQPMAPGVQAPTPVIPPKPIGPQPTWNQYALPEPHGLAKFGHLMAGLTVPTNEEFNVRPEQQAAARYGAATNEYKERVGEEEKQKAATSEAGLKAAQAGEATAKGAAATAASENVTMTINGTQYTVPQKDAEKLIGTSLQQKGAGERTTATVAGREAVAETNAGKAHYTDLDINGKKAPGKVDAQGNLLMVDGTPAPKGTTEYKAPTYAEVMGGRLTNIMVDGVPTQVQLQPQGGVKVIGEAGTGQLASRIGQAKIVQSAGDQLIKDIKANKDKMGNMQAMVSAAVLGTPWADPETQQLYSEIGSYIALHPAMHGFRGTNALDHFSKLIGGIPNNPDAMIAGIEGLSKMASIFTEPSETKGGGGKVIHYDKQGNRVKE
jgi:hypothetical protein